MTLRHAQDKIRNRSSKNEAVQRLGFLWGEEIPQDPPDFSPTPLFHQDFYLYEKSHDLVLKWLHGDYFEPSARSHIRLEIQLVDLSLPEMSKEFCVAKAVCREAIPLVFGRFGKGPFKNLASSRLIHPIV